MLLWIHWLYRALLFAGGHQLPPRLVPLPGHVRRHGRPHQNNTCDLQQKGIEAWHKQVNQRSSSSSDGGTGDLPTACSDMLPTLLAYLQARLDGCGLEDELALGHGKQKAKPGK